MMLVDVSIRTIMRRSGGDYEFTHPLIREYFAALEPEWFVFFTEREK